jgi:3D (Asp-Asp-Asp) domain-containing protein/peptidoglycan hydrolase CwlO-like protein
MLAGALLILCGLAPARVAADSASTMRARASQLTQLDTELAVKSRSALLDLYALDSRLARERAHLVALRIRTAEVRAEREAAQHRLGVARRSLAAARLNLSRRLQDLYEQGDSDPVAVILGASSVDDALSSLDSLDRIADQDRAVIEQTRHAKRTAAALARKLGAKKRDLERLAQEATQSLLVLEQARSQRRSYLAQLASQQRLNAAAIDAFQQQALAVEAASRQVSSAPLTIGPGGRTMTVVATGYAMHGNTATGAPAGWGVVAVDPGVIPLGTRMTIPGYGSGVAADTGSAIQGAAIDLWFPTLAQARAWGRRTVTIELH